jgi:hypothetical protein
MSESWVTKDEHTRKKFLEFAQEYMKEHGTVVWTWKGETRTSKQNASLHVYLRSVSDALNDAGYSVEKFFKPGYQVPFNETTVKTEIWHTMQVAVSGKDSSSDLTPAEVVEVFDRLNAVLAGKGIHVPWPSRDSKNS